MKVQITFLSAAVALATIFTPANTVNAQQYKLKQVTTMSGMKSESTIFVKGARKRTEGGGFMGMGGNLVTIEQCDLQRTITINDKKKLYYIDPFAKQEDISDDDNRPATKTKPAPVTNNQVKDEKGGVIYMYYNITDTGERKKMFGVTARHVWSTQKIKPSADACMMKDSMVIKSDGWYIDLPQFNCPVQGVGGGGYSDGGAKPTCKDRFVSKRTGKGKLGFPLIETRTMIMGGKTTNNEFVINIETLEFTTVKLDSMLFEIPLGYKEAKSMDELQEKFDPSVYMSQQGNANSGNTGYPVNPSEPKKSGMTRIGVYEPKGDPTLQAASLQQHMVSLLNNKNVEAIAVSTEEEAKKYKCDLVLATDFIKVKQGSKVGGLIKAIKNTDPTATASYNIEANLVLKNTTDGSVKAEKSVNGKFDGKLDDAARRALEKGCGDLMEKF